MTSPVCMDLLSVAVWQERQQMLLASAWACVS